LSLAFALWLTIFPISKIFCNIILLSGLIDQFTFTTECSIFKITLVNRLIFKCIDTMAIWFIILPISNINISIIISINTMAMFLFAFYITLITIAIAQILNFNKLCLHFFFIKLIKYHEVPTVFWI